MNAIIIYVTQTLSVTTLKDLMSAVVTKGIQEMEGYVQVHMDMMLEMNRDPSLASSSLATRLLLRDACAIFA